MQKTMKKIVYFIAFAALTLCACTRSESELPSSSPETTGVQTVSAVVNDYLTRSDYSISGSEAAFSWTEGDAFYRLVRKYNDDHTACTTYDHYTYSLSKIDGNKTYFQGSAVDTDNYHDSGYALYPAGKSNGSIFAYYTGTNALYFYLNDTTVYNASQPLKDIVPMVGKLNDAGDGYEFSPITGVIAVNVKHIPANATSISLSSKSGGFSGSSVLMTSNTATTYPTNITNLVGPESKGLLNSWFTAGTAKSYTFSGLNYADSYTFYFPAPVGTYKKLTVSLFAGDEEIKRVSAKKINLEIVRAKITNIVSEIDFDSANPPSDEDEFELEEASYQAALYGTQYDNGVWVTSASGNYSYYAVKDDTGDFTDETFLTQIIKEYGTKLEADIAASGFTVLTTTSTKEYGVYSGTGWRGYYEYFARNSTEYGTFKVLMLGVSSEGKVTGEYKIIGSFTVEEPFEGTPSFSDWVGTWTLQGQTCTIVSNVDGESLKISCGSLYAVLTYNSEDGSVDLAYPYPDYGGWIGADNSGNNYYLRVTNTSNQWASPVDGDIVASWAFSTKKTATVTPGSGFKAGYITAYDSSNSYLGYTSVFGQKNVFANMTKQ